MKPALVHVIGARPNFVKMAPVVTALERTEAFEQRIVHTGQHYDARMSDDILADLDFPPADHFLGVGSGNHGEQTAKVLAGFEEILLDCRPDAVMVAGDVNSTLACALAATKLGIPVAHLEAGLRSGDWSMPEEVNRVLTDRISDVLLTHSPEALDNLCREGIDPERVHYVGNTMIDSLRRCEQRARARALHRSLGLRDHDYALVTFHRPSNVDDPLRLARISAEIRDLATRHAVVFPIHPRTRARLVETGSMAGLEAAGVLCIEPVGYLDFLSLQAFAGAILTDSGGVQEEAAVLGRPTLVLRAATERPEVLQTGVVRLVGTDVAEVERTARSWLNSPPTAYVGTVTGPLRGSSHACHDGITALYMKSITPL